MARLEQHLVVWEDVRTTLVQHIKHTHPTKKTTTTQKRDTLCYSILLCLQRCITVIGLTLQNDWFNWQMTNMLTQLACEGFTDMLGSAVQQTFHAPTQTNEGPCTHARTHMRTHSHTPMRIRGEERRALHLAQSLCWIDPLKFCDDPCASAVTRICEALTSQQSVGQNSKWA